MQLFRTVCSTDWKGRPTHDLQRLSVGTQDALVAHMDLDIRQTQAEDVAREEAADREEHGGPRLDSQEAEDWTQARIQQLLADPELRTIWSNSERWEMDRKPGQIFRVLAYKLDGDYISIVYHFLD